MKIEYFVLPAVVLIYGAGYNHGHKSAEQEKVAHVKTAIEQAAQIAAENAEIERETRERYERIARHNYRVECDGRVLSLFNAVVRGDAAAVDEIMRSSADSQ